MVMYVRLHAGFSKVMQKNFHFSVFVQQSLIQVIILVLDTNVLPMLDCMLQPRCADPGNVRSPLQSAIMAILTPAIPFLGIMEKGVFSLFVLVNAVIVCT